MQLREELCQMGYQILYPCSHSDACPMLESVPVTGVIANGNGKSRP